MCKKFTPHEFIQPDSQEPNNQSMVLSIIHEPISSCVNDCESESVKNLQVHCPGEQLSHGHSNSPGLK